MSPEEKALRRAEAQKRFREKNPNYEKEYREKNKERIRQHQKKWAETNPEAVVEKSLKRNYGISLEQYKEMESRQEGLCSICRRPPVGKKRLGVDHNHTTGKIRDLLCHHCNAAIGHLMESPELMRSAAEYIERHRE